MINNNFIRKKVEFLTLKEILEITNSSLEVDNIDLNQKITGIASLENAKKNEISFLSSGTYSEKLGDSEAGFCLISEKYLSKKPPHMLALVNRNPHFAYAVLLNCFYEENLTIRNSISPKSFVEKSAVIGKNVTIMDGAYIGNNTKISDNVFIGANSVINDNVEIGQNSIIKGLVNISNSIIGKNSIIHSGVKIGQDGFGFTHNQGVNYKILQLGMVIIGDDVEIGANSCVDRGAIDNTIIGNQVKIDNLVQIAHNVEIGDGTLIAGAACVAGSTKIGKFCQIGGNCSVSGHITVGDGAKIAGASGVIKSVEAMQVVAGLPSVPIKDWHRMTIKLLKLIRNN